MKKSRGRPPLVSRNLPDKTSVIEKSLSSHQLLKDCHVRLPLRLKYNDNVEEHPKLLSESSSGFIKSGIENCSSNTNSNNATHSNDTSEVRPTLFDSLLDSKRVLVASVTVNPNRPVSSSKHSKKVTDHSETINASDSSTRQPLLSAKNKPRRRSAIAGENFVASCLLFSKNSRKSLPNEKKGSIGRPRKVPSVGDKFPVKEKKSNVKASPAKFFKKSDSIIGLKQQKDSSECKIKPLNEKESQVAFARPWITSLSHSKSNPADLSTSSPFKLSNSNNTTFKMMSFENRSAHAQKKKNSLLPKLNGSSMTAYRDMNQFGDDLDEDNDASSSSSSSSDSSESELSSSGSSCYVSSDDDLEKSKPLSLSADKQWRDSESGKKITNKKLGFEKVFSGKKANIKKRNEVSKEIVTTPLSNGSIRSENKHETASVAIKRKCGRPRKYPLKLKLTNKGGWNGSSDVSVVVKSPSTSKEPTPTPKSPEKSSTRINSADFDSDSFNLPQSRSISPSPQTPITNSLTPSLSEHSDNAADNPITDDSNPVEACDNPFSPSIVEMNCGDEPINQSSPTDEDRSSNAAFDLDQNSSSSLCIRDQSSEADSALFNKRDPTLLAWESTNSSMQNSPSTRGDTQGDSRQSLSFYSGPAMDDSFGKMFPSVECDLTRSRSDDDDVTKAEIPTEENPKSVDVGSIEVRIISTYCFLNTF